MFSFSGLDDQMNRMERMPVSGQEAIVEYRDAEFHVKRPGAFVRCAVTYTPISLDELRYWSVERQEPYLNAQAVEQRSRRM